MFFYHPRMLAYNFGPGHPLRPERLKMTVEILHVQGWEAVDPGKGEVSDVLRVHDADYVDIVQIASSTPESLGRDTLRRVGLGTPDNPIFSGMHEAALAYVAGSVRASELVREGSPLAFGMAGGLHHARRAQASGFCVYNDCAIACAILRERFSRVAYIDIDVHHGDGVQWIFYDDPTVITCSIHQDGRTLYPGTGGKGEERDGVINVPLAPGTGPEAWLAAFEREVLEPLVRMEYGAIVLQMGCDSHRTDPLARIENDTPHWLRAVELVRDLGKPIVALGGGGYDLNNVPRMWAAACLTLAGQPVPAELVED
jgi:acetoin utilization protein AcuC